MARTDGQIPQGSAFMTDMSETVSDPDPLSWMFKHRGESYLFSLGHLPPLTVLDALGAVVEIGHGTSPKKGQGLVTRIEEKGYWAGRNMDIHQNASHRTQTKEQDKACTVDEGTSECSHSLLCCTS